MRCKACNSVISSNLSKEDIQGVLRDFGFEEDLCGQCLAVSYDAYRELCDDDIL